MKTGVLQEILSQNPFQNQSCYHAACSGTNDDESGWFSTFSSHMLPICCILILETPVHYRARCNAWSSRARKVISCRHPSCTNDWRFSARILMKIPALIGFPQGWQSLPASPFSALPFQKGETAYGRQKTKHTKKTYPVRRGIFS